MENHKLTCIVCPIGCTLSVTVNEAGDIDIKGNSCARGLTYGREETVNPVRTLTTTVRLENGAYPVLPVKSDRPVPKSRLLECMKAINGLRLKAPVAAGEVVLADILGTGADIIATRDS